MTFRELLKLYKEGNLPEEQKAQVEYEIEKHEAITDYMFDECTIPDLDNTLKISTDNGTYDEAKEFTRTIRLSVRRAFVKAGIVVGVIILAVVLGAIFLLPNLASLLFYNPNKVVGTSEYGFKTTQMSLDLSVYSELFLPGKCRDIVYAENDGYGCYDIVIPQTSSSNGVFNSVAGKLKRGKLTLYNPDFLSTPTSNAFILPENVDWPFKGTGAAGSAKEAFTSLEKLDEHDMYTAYFSLDELYDYESVCSRFGKDNSIWYAVYDGGISYSNLGFYSDRSGTVMNWDKEKYPSLCLNDGTESVEEKEAKESDVVAMQTHFTSMLRYMGDNSDAAEMFGLNNIYWNDVISYIENNGIQIYGFAIVADKETILKLAESDNISYVYTVPLR